MNTINDWQRGASLFTMNGLADPRLMPQYKVAKRTVHHKEANGFKKWMERIIFSLLSSGGA